jgi:transketolase
MYVFRPADGIEVAMSYYAALERKDGPSSLIFSRQGLPVLERPAGWSADDVLKGGYVLKDSTNPQIQIVATGSEVGISVAAAAALETAGIATRVISMPCVELFNAQDEAYRDAVLPNNVKTVVVEAGTTIGWGSLLDRRVDTIGIDHYGASAPGNVLAEKFGFTAEAVEAKIKALL